MCVILMPLINVYVKNGSLRFLNLQDFDVEETVKGYLGMYFIDEF